MASRPVTALLVVDMVSLFDFPDAGRIAPGALRASRHIHALRRRFRDRGWPVVYANDHFADWQAGFHDLVAMASATEGPACRIAACPGSAPPASRCSPGRRSPPCWTVTVRWPGARAGPPEPRGWPRPMASTGACG